MNWQPIDIAPKDETVFIAYSPGVSPIDAYEIGYWCNIYKDWVSSAHNESLKDVCGCAFWAPLHPPEATS